MITLISMVLLIAMIVGVVKLFGWMASAAFHLLPFLLEAALVILVIIGAAYLLSWIGIIGAVVLMGIGCIGSYSKRF